MHGRHLAMRGSRFGSCRGRGEFLGMDTGAMGRGAKVSAALSVIGAVAVSGVFLFVFVPELWWLLTVYGWVVFPAFGLLARGVSETSEERPRRASESAPSTSFAASPERELLEALRRNGELTPAFAAMETSLSVAEADEMLGGLAKDGHLEVRVKDGGVFYAMWGSEPR